MKKYTVCLAIGLLLLNVTGYAQGESKGDYDVNMSLSLSRSNGHCTYNAGNYFLISFKANGQDLNFKGINFGCNSYHLYEQGSFTLKEGSSIQFVSSTDNRCWNRSFDYTCRGSVGVSLRHLSITPSGYSSHTLPNVLGNWSSTLYVTVQPKELKLAYKNGKVTSDWGGPLPSKHYPITLSCTPGYPDHVYQWQYMDGFEDVYDWTTTYIQVPVPCEGTINYAHNYANVYDIPGEFIRSDGSIDHSYHTSDYLFAGYYKRYEEYDEEKFYFYLTMQLPDPNYYCTSYATVPVRVKTEVPRWVDFPDHINNRASITFTGEELLGGEAAFTARMNTTMPVRVNHQASNTYTLSLGLQRSAPKLLAAQASTPCAGQRGSLTLSFDRPLDAAAQELLNIAVRKDFIGELEYDEYIDIKAGEFDGATYVMENLEPGTYEIMCATSIINGSDGRRVNTYAPEDTTEVTITAWPAVKASIPSPVPVKCYGGSDGSIIVVPSEGSGSGYTISVTNSADKAYTVSNGTASSLTAGAYTVQVADGNGCQMKPQTVEVTQPEAALSVSASESVKPSCNGKPDGEIKAWAQGGTSPYSYTCSGVTNTTGVFSGLPKGNYTVSVIDANNCNIGVVVTLSELPPLKVSIASSQSITCNGGSNGALLSSVSGGNSNNTYQWSRRNTGWSITTTSSSISGLSAGTYDLTVKDGRSCTATANYTLTEPTTKVSATISASAEKCYGSADGSIAVRPSGGSGSNYTVSLSTGASAAGVPKYNERSFTNLPAGTYSVKVKDNAECTAAYNVNVASATPLTVAALSPQLPGRYGYYGNGSLSFSATGGTGMYTYTYTLKNASGGTISSNTQGAFSSLSAGSYTVVVRDRNYCETGFSTYLPNLLEIQMQTYDNVSCNGDANGYVIIEKVSGGVGAYTYQWYDVSSGTPMLISGATGLTLANLKAGTYRFKVTDQSGLSATADYAIYEPSDVMATLNPVDVKCHGASAGSIMVKPSGGTRNNYNVAVYKNNVLIQSASGITRSTGHDFTGLPAGDYNVKTTGNPQCATASQYVKVGSVATPVTIAVLSPQLPGSFDATDGSLGFSASGGVGAYTYTLKNASGQTVNNSGAFSGLAAGSYTVTVKDGNQCETALSTYLPNPLEIQLQTQYGISCNGSADGSITIKEVKGGVGGYTYRWYNVSSGSEVLIATGSTLANRPAGTYRCIVTDQSGRSASADYVLTEPEVLTATLSSVDIKCFGVATGSIMVQPDGGTENTYKVELYKDNVLIRSADGVSKTAGHNFTDLTEGYYNLRLKDNAGCASGNNDNVYIASVDAPVTIVNLSSQRPHTHGTKTGRISLSAIGGVGAYTYILKSPASGQEIASTLSGAFSGLGAGSYTVTVKDGNQCETDTSLYLYDPLLIQLQQQENVLCHGWTTGSLAIKEAVGGVGSYTYQWYTVRNGAPALIPGATGLTLTNRPAGTYRVIAKDRNGLSGTVDYTIAEPEEVTATLTAVDERCYGITGSIMVQPGGGTENTYKLELYKNDVLIRSVNGVSKAAGHNFTDLPGGDYNVKTTGNTQCATASQSVKIASVSAPVAIVALSSQLPGVYGATDGRISLSATGGVGTYTYLLKSTATGQEITSNTSGAFAGLEEGSYTVAVKDGNQCETDTALYLPNPLLIQLHRQENILCYGFATGELEIEEAKGGIGGYTYQWYDTEGLIPGATGLTLANRPAGTYSVEVKERNGLSASVTCVLTENKPLTYGVQLEKVKCYGETTGAINVHPQGGAGDEYRVRLHSNAGGLLHDVQINREDAYSFDNLKSAHYVLKLTDGKGCVAADTLVLVDSVKAPLKLSLENHLDPLGYERIDGYITLTASGGAAPYRYTLAADTGRVGQNDHGLFTGLGKGIYDIVLHDSYNCADALQVVLNQPPPLEINWKSYKDIDCKDAPSGSLTAHEATGGVGNYTYRWYKWEREAWDLLPSATTTALNNITAGTYRIEATDANGITAAITHTLQEPEYVTYTSTSMPVHCYGGADGIIEAVAAGGTEQTYRFKLSSVSDKEYAVEVVTGKDTAHRFTGLRPGKYMLDLEDNAGCAVHREEAAKIIVVDSVAAPLRWMDHWYHDPLAYGRSDGLVQIIAEGGTAPYAFTFSGTSLAAGISETLLEGEEYMADSLQEGVYHLLITDKNYYPAEASGVLADRKGCMDTLTVRLVAPPELMVNIELLSGIPCKGMHAARLQAVGSGGVVYTGKDYHYEWYQRTGDGLQPVASGSSVAEQLAIGTYTVKITDNNGIIAWADDFVVTEPATLLSVTTQAQATVCGRDDGVAIAMAEGGTPPYTYEWSSGHQTQQAGFLNIGRYMVLVRDNNNCESSAFAVVPGNDKMRLEEQLIRPTCYNDKDGSIRLQMQGGLPPYRYRWDDGDTSSVITGLSQGVYSVQIIDAEGCKMDMTYELLHPERLTVDAGDNRSLCKEQQVTIQANGSRTIKEYNWYHDGVPYDDQSAITVDREGVYSVSVADESGCRADTSVVVNLLNKDIAVDLSIGKYVTLNEAVYAVNDAWQKTDSVRWILPENNVALLEENERSVQLRFLSAGTFEIGTINYKEGCYNAIYKTVEVVGDVVKSPKLSVSIKLAAGIPCKGMHAARLQAVGSGGILQPGKDYHYEWYRKAGNGLQPVASGGVARQLAIGTYTVKITDNNGVIAWADDFVVTEPEVLSVTAQAQATTCGRYNGVAMAMAEGGTAPYTYEWSSGHRTQQAGDLRRGQYVVLVRDSNRCESEALAEVTGNDSLRVEEFLVHPTCYNYEDGSIHLQLQGGLPPYRYHWNNGDTSSVLAGLPQGTYTVQVSDVEGCKMDRTYELLHPERLTVDVGSDRSICEERQATIQAEASRTIREYNWHYNGAPYDDQPAITVDREGVYSVSVFDESGCRADTSVTVNFLNENIAVDLSIGGYVALNETVYAVNASWNEADSVRWVLPENEVALLEENERSVQLRFLSAGTFEIGMFNYKEGCYNVTYETVEVIGGKSPELTVSIEQLAGIPCKGMRVAKLQAVGSGGILQPGKDYRYEWYQHAGNGLRIVASGSSIIEQLTIGTYTVKITDSDNRIAWAGDFVVTEPEALSVTAQAQAMTCGQYNGAVMAIVEGGTAPYTYEWSSGHRTQQAGNLRKGRYMVLVKDSNRCEVKAFAEVTGNDSLRLEEQLVHPTCYNYKSGSIRLQLQGGQTPYRYRWNDADTSAVRTGLPKGVYSVQIIDAEGCRMDRTYELTQPERLTVEAGSDRTICEGQQVTIQAVASRPIREYNWYYNGDPYDNGSAIIADRKGVYSISVFDEAGCRADTSVTVKFLEVDIAADFLISGYVALDEAVYAVNISWPEPDSTRWVLPENNVAVLDDDEHWVQLCFLSTGTFEIGLLSYKDGCYETVYKTVEVVDETDNIDPKAIKVSGMKYAGVYPNPASGYFTVKIELEKDVPVTLKLFTMNGLLLKTEQLQGSTSYEHLFTMPGGVIPGIYFLQILTPDSSNLTKLLLY